MEIRILDFVDGAKKAEGIAVIIDVFRAFSLEAYAFAMGVERVIPVGDINLALKIKKDKPDFILAGERHESKPEGFDLGNSPSQLSSMDLKGKTLVHTTSAGTQGLVNASSADEILTGAFVNASAIVDYIKRKDPAVVSLVAMGYEARYRVEEDSYCAEYIQKRLLGQPTDMDAYREIIRKTSGARFFVEEKQGFAPASDFDMCLELNRFNFVCKAIHSPSWMEVHRIDFQD